MSALLEEIDVRGRVDLMLEATDLFLPEAVQHKKEGNAPGGVAPEVTMAPMFGGNGRSRQLIPLDRRSGGR